MRVVQFALRLRGNVGTLRIVVDTGSNCTNGGGCPHPRIGNNEREQRLKGRSKPEDGFGGSRYKRNKRRNPGTNSKSFKNILVFCQQIKGGLQTADRSTHGIDAGNGGVGVDERGFEQRPFRGEPVDRTLQPLRCGFGGGPKILLHNFC